MTPRELDPHGFRRAVHACGAALIVLFYTTPAAWRPGFSLLLLLLLAASVAVEAARARGLLASAALTGLRPDEHSRVASHVWFGVSFVALALAFPPAIALPSLLALAAVDPVVGDLRPRLGRPLAAAAGALLATGLFAVCGWGPWSLAAAAAAVAGEGRLPPWPDDDLVVPLAPAALLATAAALGLATLPAPLLPAGAFP